MKKLESSLLNMALVLTGVAVIMGAVLAWVNSVTTDPIAQQQKKALADGIKSVMQAEEITVSKIDTLRETNAKGKEQIFIIYNNEKGAAVESTTDGFGGKLRVLVGFNPDGKILGYTILEHAETPGLGAKADKWFQADGKGSIVGLTPSDPLVVTKDGGQVEAITASTITSRAFLKAVNNAYHAYMVKPTDAQTGATKQHKEK